MTETITLEVVKPAFPLDSLDQQISEALSALQKVTKDSERIKLQRLVQKLATTKKEFLGIKFLK